jgi:hypothetical protein
MRGLLEMSMTFKTGVIWVVCDTSPSMLPAVVADLTSASY